MKSLRFIFVGSLLGSALIATEPAAAQPTSAAEPGPTVPGGSPSPPAPGGRIGQLENAKIAFLTSRLTLTQDQAQRFWPLYNDFIKKRKELNRSARLLRRDASDPSLSDDQLRKNINQDFALRQQQLDLERDFSNRALKVLTVRQVALLSQAERDFTKEVLKRVAVNGTGQ